MWNVVRVAYFDEGKASLLLGPVHEVCDRLRRDGVVRRMMVLPHWKRGPHVDVIADCDAQVFEERVAPLCREVIGAWIARHPSATVLDAAKYELLSQRLGFAELEPGPYVPLLDNNTVSTAAYAPSATLKLPEFAVAKEDFLASSLDLAFVLLREKQNDANACLLTLAAMMAIVGETYEAGGLARGFLSYRSHAQYFFSVYDQSGALRTRFDALDRALAPALDECVRCVLRSRFEDIPLDAVWRDTLLRWRAIANETARECRAIVARHHDTLVNDQTFARLAEVITKDIPRGVLPDPNQAAPNAMWTAFQHDKGQRVLTSREFLAYRATVNFFYLLLPFLEISPAQKFCVCHLVSNATERVLGTSWQSLMGMGTEPEVVAR